MPLWHLGKNPSPSLAWMQRTARNMTLAETGFLFSDYGDRVFPF